MVNKKKVFLRIALPTPLRRLFDYLPPQDIDLQALMPGVRVKVPFQSRTLVGVLVGVVDESSVPYGKLKRVEEVLDVEPIIPADVFKLCLWAADYYHYSLGEILSVALPVLLRKSSGQRRTREQGARLSDGAAPAIDAHPRLTHAGTGSRDGLTSERLAPEPARPVLSVTQKQAVDEIKEAQSQFHPFLLDGVTGSGKTEVYLRAIEHYLEVGKQVLVLVPEISLTPQTIERFRLRFHQKVVALHSGLTDKQRLEAWEAAGSGDAKIVIGTRSAIFTPFASLGLIIVDEEHDPSFKQNDRFRYHARDLAVMRASLNHIPIVLGSATPSLESLLNVKRERYTCLSLPERAGNALLPQYQLLDMNALPHEEGISLTLIDAMRVHLEAGNQVMLFLNRRGFAPVMYCTECAWIANCQRCDARMVYHRKPLRLQCHHCDARRDIPSVCEQCHASALQPIGLGTQRLEETIKKYFPDIPIIRIDRDSTRRKDAMQDLLNEIHAEPKAILLGTQMLAKGHHFPNVTLVGIIDADSGLFSSDFRATEQMGQLLLQVSGRAGREEKPGTVMIQTRHPEHPLLQILIQQGYAAFSTVLLDEREKSLLPPYSYFAVVRAEAYTEKNAEEFLLKIKSMCGLLAESISLWGPVPALLTKRKGLHCKQLLIKSHQRPLLQKFLQTLLQKIDTLPAAQTVKWVLDVDPIEVN